MNKIITLMIFIAAVSASAHEHKAAAAGPSTTSLSPPTVAKSEWEMFRRHLHQPEYLHVLLNPLPVYMVGTGALALAVAFMTRSRHARMVSLLVIAIGAASVWPVLELGQQAYDRMYDRSETMTKQWLDVHMERAEQYAYFFYVTALVSLAAALAEGRGHPHARRLSAITLLAAITAIGVGGWISHSGGQVRHFEFREGPPPGSHALTK